MKRVDDKVTGATLGAAIATILVAELQKRGASLSAEEIGAVAVIGTFVGGWFKRRVH